MQSCHSFHDLVCGNGLLSMSEMIPAGGEVGLLLPVLLAEGATGAVDADAARADGRAPRLGLRAWCRGRVGKTVEGSWAAYAQGGWESHTKPEPAGCGLLHM